MASAGSILFFPLIIKNTIGIQNKNRFLGIKDIHVG
jgi:hypothetical protein